MQKQISRLISFVALGLFSVAAMGQETASIPEKLRETYGAFAAAMVKGQTGKAAAFSAEDAVVLVDHGRVYRGRSAIREDVLPAFLDSSVGKDKDAGGTEIEVDRAVAGDGAVSLAGRYSNQPGDAGVYSNTWRRHVDGSRKLAISVMTFEAAGSATVPSRERFSCTQVLGFSQSMEWYAGLSVADYMDQGTRPDLSALEPDAFLPGWQGRFFMGAAIEKWADPGFPGWSGAHPLAHETPAHCRRDEVDRVVFNVSGEARSANAWAAAIDSVVDVIRAKFPAVQEIVMQPMVGAPEGECTNVRAARNQPVIAEGVRRAAGQGGVTAGTSPKVENCSQFSDDLGHLTAEGAEHIRRALRKHYQASIEDPERDPRAARGGDRVVVEKWASRTVGINDRLLHCETLDQMLVEALADQRTDESRPLVRQWRKS